MSSASPASLSSDPIWTAVRAEAWSEEEREPILRSYLLQTILKHKRLEDALSLHLAAKLATSSVPAVLVHEIINEALQSNPAIGKSIRDDLQAVRDRDPASRGYLVPFLYFKGFHALQSYRIANWLWGRQRCLLAIQFQSRISEVFCVDIHPAARVGSGILIDHGTGVVIGETCDIAAHVKIYQGVTLGALSFDKDHEGNLIRGTKRHPTIEERVVIYANATVLGGTTIVGANSVIGASVSLTKSVPPNTVVTIEKPSLRFREAV